MSRIAAGAAAENIYVAAQSNNWSAELTDFTNNKLRIRLVGSGVVAKGGAVPELIKLRVTNRRPFQGQPVAPNDMGPLKNLLQPRTDLRPAWVWDRSLLAKLAKVIGTAERLMFGIRAVRQEWLQQVRLDQPAGKSVEEGLPTGSLELGWGSRTGLRLFGAIPDRIYWLAGVAASVQTKAKNLVLSSAGMCFLLCDRDDPQTDFQVGQLMQQAWLALTARNYAVQPLMSLPTLDYLRVLGAGEVDRSIGFQTAELTSLVQSCVEMSSHERIAAVLRFGRASAPSGRTGRRGAATVTIVRDER